MTDKKYPSVPAEDVAERLKSRADELEYWAWPQVFGSTAGPFVGIGGQAMTTFTIEAWHDGGGKAALFCNGKVFKITDQFEPQMRL
jgi:hypothetical protein